MRMTPEERTSKLASIALDDARAHHGWLRKCFSVELEQRLLGGVYEAYENIYHCALLLHVVADITDLPLMHSAKCSGDMDLGIGFDWQFLFMKEPEVLISYANSIDRVDISCWINDRSESYMREDMEIWLTGRIDYHGAAQTGAADPPGYAGSKGSG
jgi:hypothetical protein